MPGHEKDKKHRDYKKESKEESSINHDKDGLTINITINIGNIHIEQRAEGGGQINKDVGTNANRRRQRIIIIPIHRESQHYLLT
jgi:hypothetical protein